MSPFKNLGKAIRDTAIIAHRNLLRYVRLPQLLFFSLVQPIMFLVLFNYVFGGALGAGSASAIPGGKYINFLLPGILIQTVMFGGVNTGIGLATDMGLGIIDRYRSLPMSRLAVVAGRTLADLVRNIAMIVIMVSVGMLLGFRFQNGLGGALGLVGISALFGYALSWAFAYIGMSVKDAETAQLASFLAIFPLTFASAAFVPTQTLPGWLQVFVRNQPVTHVVNASREFALGVTSGGAPWKATTWAIGLLVIFVPLAVRAYKKRT